MRLETFLDVFESQRRVSQEAKFRPPSDGKRGRKNRNIHFSRCPSFIHFFAENVCVFLEVAALLTLKPGEEMKAPARLQFQPPPRSTWI